MKLFKYEEHQTISYKQQVSLKQKVQNYLEYIDRLANNFPNIGRQLKFLMFGALTCLAAALIAFWQLWEVPLISPLANGGKVRFLSNQNVLGLSSQTQSPKQSKIVYGFLPYWNVDHTLIQPELTHLSYFGLNIGEDGDVVIQNDEGAFHAGYNKLNSQQLWNLVEDLKQQDGEFELVLVQFDPDKIVELVNNEQAHQNLITSIDSMLLAYPISGINIDIEYSGKVTGELRDNFASLIEKIKNHLDQKFGNVQLSIDMYANASNNRMLWDVPRIGQSVDYIIVMAYDFHLRSSPQAGPVAPLFGGKQNWSIDIHQNLREYLRYVPNEKILLGIPFYGYQWQTECRSPQSKTFPGTGSTASYKRVQELITNSAELELETGWDDNALSPYLSFIKDDNIYMIYYENPTSISYKMEYVNQLDLGGIAIWALGYDGHTRELWDVLAKRL